MYYKLKQNFRNVRFKIIIQNVLLQFHVFYGNENTKLYNKSLFSELNTFEVNICTCMLKVSFWQLINDKSLDSFVVTIDYNQIPLIVLIYYVRGVEVIHFATPNI